MSRFDQLREGLVEVQTGRGEAVGSGPRPAAVLALLTEGPHPELLFTERASHLRHHAGQMSFPGGRIDRGDPSPRAAALREAHEEIGLDPSTVSVLGQLPATSLTTTFFRVTTLVGTWDGRALLQPHEAEVAAVHRYPVDLLSDPEVRRSALLPLGGRGPAFVVDDVVVWGFTAHLVDHLLELAGWAKEWDRERVTEVPPRFRRAGL